MASRKTRLRTRILAAGLALSCAGCIVLTSQDRRVPADTSGDSGTSSTTTSTDARDLDGDGFDEAHDCDDTDPDIHPDADEWCNDGVDSDCSGDEDDDAVDATAWYPDEDEDTWGSDSATATYACSEPAGWVQTHEDCDDNDSSIHPEQPDACDDVDNDCDNATDEDADFETLYADEDGDGYGDEDVTMASCAGSEDGWSFASGDCDDEDEDRSPAEPEVCDKADQDCDGDADEGVLSTYYLDEDGDGYGTSSTTTEGCSLPTGYAEASGDCNDDNECVRPGVIEYCSNGVDDNCNGATDGFPCCSGGDGCICGYTATAW